MATEMIRVLVRLRRNTRMTAAASRDPCQACSVRFLIAMRMYTDWSNENPSLTLGGMPIIFGKAR